MSCRDPVSHRDRTLYDDCTPYLPCDPGPAPSLSLLSVDYGNDSGTCITSCRESQVCYSTEEVRTGPGAQRRYGTNVFAMIASIMEELQCSCLRDIEMESQRVEITCPHHPAKENRVKAACSFLGPRGSRQLPPRMSRCAEICLSVCPSLGFVFGI